MYQYIRIPETGPFIVIRNLSATVVESGEGRAEDWQRPHCFVMLQTVSRWGSWEGQTFPSLRSQPLWRYSVHGQWPLSLTVESVGLEEADIQAIAVFCGLQGHLWDGIKEVEVAPSVSLLFLVMLFRHLRHIPTPALSYLHFVWNVLCPDCHMPCLL